jgi:hypothetical protein
MPDPIALRRAAADAFASRAAEFLTTAEAGRELYRSTGVFDNPEQARLAIFRAMGRASCEVSAGDTPEPVAASHAASNATEWSENADKGTASFQFKGALDSPMKVDELLAASGVDLTKWKVSGIEVKAWGVTSKIREFAEGRPIGEYLQAGKNFYLSVKLTERKATVAEAMAEAEGRMISRLSNEPIRYMPPADFLAAGEDTANRLLEPCIFDLHLEKLAWGPETGGADWGTKIAASGCLAAAEDLLNHYRHFGRILLPLGNDFFHCDNMRQNTSNGSHLLDADVRWAEAWDTGCDVAINLVKLCLEFAPVDVLIIPGNHDTQRSTFMGRVLKECFRATDHVTVDHSPGSMKRFRWGRTLLGFCHGSPRNEPYHKLGMEMMTRWPEDLPGTVHREWHVGDQHRMRSQSMNIEGFEEQSLRVRVIPSLCSPDAWHAANLYHNIRAAECYLWHKEDCYVGHHSYNIALRGKDRARLA